MRRIKEQQPTLVHQTTVKIRFSDVDSMKVVWHGQYVHYLEDGRESFGRQYGIGYNEITQAGYLVPIVELNLQYKQSLKYGDTALIETRYMHTEAAKIVFEYIIYRESDHSIVATASSIQVFVNKETEQLELNNPSFYLDWKEKWNIR